MNIPDRFTLEQRAHQLRRAEISRIFDATASAITNWLRQRHEGALRRPQRSVRMRPVNATPA